MHNLLNGYPQRAAGQPRALDVADEEEFYWLDLLKLRHFKDTEPAAETHLSVCTQPPLK